MCSAHFQVFVYWVGVMFVHVMCTQCVVVWLQYRFLGFCFYALAAQGALPPSTRPQIFLNVHSEEQPSHQPAGRGPEAGNQRRTNVLFLNRIVYAEYNLFYVKRIMC